MTPDFAALLANPARVAEVPAAELPALLGEVEHVKALLWARLVAPPPLSSVGNGEADRLLTVSDVAARTTLSRAYLYRHADTLPFFARRVGRKLLFSDARLTRWLAQRPRLTS